MDKNSITLQGNLGSDAQTTYTQDGLAVTKLSLATHTAKGQTDWHSVVMFGPLAEDSKGLLKGQRVELQGSLRSHAYSQDGKQLTDWSVRATSCKVLAREREPGLNGRTDVAEPQRAGR